MTAHDRRSSSTGSATSVLVGVVLFLGLAAATAMLAPIVQCPDCTEPVSAVTPHFAHIDEIPLKDILEGKMKEVQWEITSGPTTESVAKRWEEFKKERSKK